MSIKSKQRNEHRPNPVCRKTAQPGPYRYYIRQKPKAEIDVYAKIKTKGAFGKSAFN